MNKISLNGKWNVIGRSPDGEKRELTANVPGAIHLDLERENIIPDMFFGKNAELCQWVEHWYWEYSREFDIPGDADLEYSVLEFGGLDTYAEIYINGKLIDKTEDMHTPYLYRGKDILKHGKNTVRVAFSPYQDHIKGKRLDYPVAFFNSERVHVRRMQCTFYWDWVNRFVTFGLWRPVTVYFYEPAHISDLFVWTHDIEKTSASLQIVMNFDYDDDAYITRAELELFSPQGNSVYYDEFEVWDREMRLQADIEDPELWWPNGYGEQPLYRAVLTLHAPDGSVIDTFERTFGIRTTRVEQIQDKDGSEYREKVLALRALDPKDKMGDRPSSGFILLINGVRIMCKGGNWVPADPFPSRITPEKYDELIRLARDAGMNVMRCWGGGIYEPQEFFDACNKYGIMITQDFQLSCGEYPEDDEEFMAKIHREIPIVIKQLRNNPCIVWWCGDNENAMNYKWDDRKACDRRLVREVFNKYMPLYDPSRPFFPLSPYKGYPNNEPSTGDCHMSWWEHLDGKCRENIKTVGRYESECALAGSPLEYTLRRFMSEEDLHDETNDMFEYHVKDNPHKAKGAPTLFGKMAIQSELMFGKSETNEKRLFDYAYVQYEWVRLQIEASRRAKWFTAGVQFWMYNDCWPAVGWSMVDYYLIPKAAWYAAKLTCQPVTASVTDDDDGKNIEFYILNDSRKDARGTVTAFVQGFDGTRRELFKCGYLSKANENIIINKIPADKINLGKSEVIICELSGDASSRAYFYGAKPLDMSFKPTKISYEISGSKEGTITFKCTEYARAVTVEGDIVLSDNFFDMLPGEEKTVSFYCHDGFDVKDVKIYCVNEAK